jgi:hypothetical protein
MQMSCSGGACNSDGGGSGKGMTLFAMHTPIPLREGSQVPDRWAARTCIFRGGEGWMVIGDGDGRTPERMFMSVYTIDRENNITVFASLKEIEASGGERESLSNPGDLAALADQWPGARLVEIWNGLPGVEPVQRFTSRKVAVTRIWKAIQHLKRGVAARTVGSNKASTNQKRSRAARRRLFLILPFEPPVPVLKRVD